MVKRNWKNKCRKSFAAILTAAMLVNSVSSVSAAGIAIEDTEALSESVEVLSDDSAEMQNASENGAVDVQTADSEEQTGEQETEETDVSFEQTKTVDGIQVSVSAEAGVFPEGASLQVQKVTDTDVLDTFEEAVGEQDDSQDALVRKIARELKELSIEGVETPQVAAGNDLTVFDITIHDSNGEEIQPDTNKGETKVSFSNIETGDETEEIQVFHADDELKQVEELAAKSDVKAGMAEAVTEHFSYYCLSTLTNAQLSMTRLGSQNGGYTLSSGVYYLTANETFNGSYDYSGFYGRSGLTISGTVYLYIPEGKTLTAIGGSGSGTTGGGAGIYVPSGSNLILFGGGTVNATGGNAANGSTGGTGGNSVHTGGGGSDRDYYAGAGGTGGNGGGGAGAGIGTSGGPGGSGYGSGGSEGPWADQDKCADGVNGSNGASGYDASAMGTLYKTDAITINASGGKSGSGGSGGSAGNSVRGTKDTDRGISGGSGGGGGGGGKAGAAIGTGGGGGGQGGGGGRAGYLWGSAYLAAGGGGGGRGAALGDCGYYGANGTFNYWRDTGIITYPTRGDGYKGGQGAYGYVETAGGTKNYATSGNGGNGGDAGKDAESKDPNTLADTQNLYNTITFKDDVSPINGTFAKTQNYYITKQTTITLPDYTLPENLQNAGWYFCGWQVVTNATSLPASYGETSCGLDVQGNIYKSGTTFEATGVYGDVTMYPALMTVTPVSKTHTIDVDHRDYDVSQLFAITKIMFPEGHPDAVKEVGAATYSIVSEGTTGEGRISGNTLTVDKVGTFKIKMVTKATDLYVATETIATVEIHGQPIHPYVQVSDWTYGDEPNTPWTTGNTGNGEETFYYKPYDQTSAAYTTVVPSDAGKYYLKVKIGPSLYDPGESNPVVFEIRQKPLTIVPKADQSKIYGDADPVFTYDALDDDGNPGLVTGNPLEGALSRDSGENVGTYAFTIGTLHDEQNNYALTLAPGEEFTINQKDIASEDIIRVLSKSDFAYEDEYIDVTAKNNLTVSTTRAFDGQLYNLKESKVSTDKTADFYVANYSRKERGEYKLKLYGMGNYTGKTTLDWSIVRNDINYTATGKEVTYDGNEYSITVKPEFADAKVTYSETGADGSYTEVNPTYSNAGTYTVYFKIYRNDDYNEMRGSETVKIKRRKLTITAPQAAEKTYGEADPEWKVSDCVVTDGPLVDDESITSVTVDRDTNATGENVGTYDLKVSDAVILDASGADMTENYNITYNLGKLKINQRPITITADSQQKIYGDTDPEFTYQVTTGSIAQRDESGLAGSLTRETGEDVRSYNILKGTIETANTNYDITYVGAALTINQKELTADMLQFDQTHKFTGTRIIPVVTVVDSTVQVPGTGFDTSYNDGKEHKDVNAYRLQGDLQAQDFGAYRITMTGQGNYKGEITKDWYITNIPEKTTVEYDGEEHTVDTTEVPENVTITYATEKDGTYSAQLPMFTNAGVYPVYYEMTCNGETSKAVTTLEITKKAATVTADNKSKIWGTADPELTYSVVGLIEGESLGDVIVISRESGEDEATYAITVALKEGATVQNYELTFVPGTFTINPDQTNPGVNIKIGSQKWNNEFVTSITFEKYYKTEPQVTITAFDDEGSGIDQVSYYLASAEKTKAQLDAVDWTTYDEPFTLSEGKSVVYVKVSDRFGNTSYCSSNGVVVDKTAPQITGIEEDKIYCAPVTITVTDTYLDQVMVNGKKVALTDGTYTIPGNETAPEYTVVAVDKAGNESETVTATVYPDHSFTKYVPDNNASMLANATETAVCDHGCGATHTREIPDTKIEKEMTSQPVETENKLSTQINVDNDVPKTAVTGLNINVAKEFLTPEEMNSGKDIKIYLDVRKALDAEVETAKQKVENVLNGAQAGLYFDLSLFKKVAGEKTEKLHETKDSLTVTMKIPDELKTNDASVVRTYSIIRVHEGTASVIPSVYDAQNGILKFETDRFSTYVIAYKDTQLGGGGGGSVVVPVPILSLTVLADKTTLTKAGETAQLTAQIIPESATNKNVTWKSSDESVATVDETGKVTAVANGTATITATAEDGGKTASVDMTVKIEKPVTEIALSADKTTLTKAGETAQLTVKVTPEDADAQEFTWKSDKESVATVDENGKVTAVANGTAVITVTTKDGKYSDEITITVAIPEDKPIKAVSGFGKLRANSAKQTTTSITLNWTKIANADGYIIYGSRCTTGTKTYKVQKLKTITNNSTLTWTHKSLKKGTYYKYVVKAYRVIDGKQVITDISTCIHVITKGGKYGMAKAVSVTKISGSNTTTGVTLKVGKSAKISAKEIQADKAIHHHRGICYESSNKKVATVSKTGVIQAKGKGTCKVWVYAQNGVYKTITVTVK